MNPFFSIIIPCCNVEPYIEECLRSIQNQSFQDWECLVVVETSRDRTEQLVRTFVEKDKRFRYFTQPRSGSPSAGRNTGLEDAHGKYVVFVDGDDFIRDNKLAELAERITEHPGADLYPCAVLNHDTRTGMERTIDNYPQNAPAEMSFLEAISFLRHLKWPCPQAQMTIYRREYLNNAGLRFVYGLLHEDNEFFPRALFYAKRIAPLHVLFYFRRIVPNSIMTDDDHWEKHLKAYARVFRRLFAFHARVSKAPDFDPVISKYWANQWIPYIWTRWFFSRTGSPVLCKYQIATLRFIFAHHQDDFRLLARHLSPARRFVCLFLLLPVICPPWTIWITYSFFHIYSRLVNLKKRCVSSP